MRKEITDKEELISVMNRKLKHLEGLKFELM